MVTTRASGDDVFIIKGILRTNSANKKPKKVHYNLKKKVTTDLIFFVYRHLFGE